MFGLNKYILYAILTGIAIAIISTYVIMWKSGIRKQALLEFNNQQLQQTISDQELYITNMKLLNESQNAILDNIKKQNESMSKQLADIEDYLNSEEAKKNDRPASPIIKETIRRLSGQNP